MANGEVWDQLEITDITRTLDDTPCPAQVFCGWMVAQTKVGTVEEILLRNVRVQDRQISAEAPKVDDGSAEPEGDPLVLAFLAKCLLPVFGTALGVTMTSREKLRSVRPKTWLYAIV